MSEDVDDFLAHYGVKGMKWGKRKRRQEALAKRSAEGRKADELLAKRTTYGNRALTNKQLETLNRRLGMEQSLNNLTRPPAKTGAVKKGHSYAREMLAIGATVNAAYAFSETTAGQALKKMFKEKVRARTGYTGYGAKTNVYHVPVAQLALGK